MMDVEFKFFTTVIKNKISWLNVFVMIIKGSMKILQRMNTSCRKGLKPFMSMFF
jgi:hypothetical protein